MGAYRLGGLAVYTASIRTALNTMRPFWLLALGMLAAWLLTGDKLPKFFTAALRGEVAK